MRKIKISDMHKSIVDEAMEKIYRDSYKSNKLLNKTGLYTQLIDEITELITELTTPEKKHEGNKIKKIEKEMADVLNQMALLLAA